MSSNQKLIVYYDGSCGFCNSSVQWILKRDTHQVFHFASLQSDFAQHRLPKSGISINLDTIIVEKDTSSTIFYTKSDAIIEILAQLESGKSWAKLLKLCPRFLRNIGYNLFAKIRHKVQSNSNRCMLLNDVQKKQFLDR